MVATPETLVDRARARTHGLSDLGPVGWEDGLEHLVDAVARDGVDDDAVATIEAIVVTRLVVRLRVEEWYANHEAEAVHPVEAPLVIIGLPRTATTALHYLLALDSRFRYPRDWEIKNPVPPPEIASERDDPRRPSQPLAPDVRHITSVDGPAEDWAIHAFHFHHAELVLPVPSYTDWWRSADHATSFVYHERILRLLHSRRPPYRWLLKLPAYLFELPELVAQYASARFVMTHRDPVAALPSTCSTILHSRELRLPGRSPEPTMFGRAVLEHFAEGMRRALDARATLGEHRFLDVGQPDLEADPVGTVERVYDFAGLDLDPRLRSAMASWAAENRRGARGEHRYDAAGFGLTPADIRHAFAEYLDAFGALCATTD